MGLILPSAEFLRELRQLTEKNGALLIYDEVMTGFRLAGAALRSCFGRSLTWTVLGKIVGA